MVSNTHSWIRASTTTETDTISAMTITVTLATGSVMVKTGHVTVFFSGNQMAGSCQRSWTGAVDISKPIVRDKILAFMDKPARR